MSKAQRDQGICSVTKQTKQTDLKPNDGILALSHCPLEAKVAVTASCSALSKP